MTDGLPRLLAIMGSGETSPTMVKVHRRLFEQLGPPPVPAVLLDTPFGFQENASDISARVIEYFAQSVGRPIEVASFRSQAGTSQFDYETMLLQLRRAHYVFSGPGSPSYALRQWQGSAVPEALADRLRTGGAIVFASAAALTLGRVTVPVYEIYKVGEEPHWLPGLDLLSVAGLSVAVIPHFNNAEGGTHDTRFCYLGERRLAGLEEQLPPETFVLGVDEHTACILDLGSDTLTVAGLGVVTIRRRGRATELSAGSAVSFEALRVAAEHVDSPPVAALPTSPKPETPQAPPPCPPATTPFLGELARLEEAFDAALSKGDPPAAATAVLELDQALVDWSRDTLQSDELDRGRSTLRAMVVRLAEWATKGTHDSRALVEPYVEVLVMTRARLRAERRWKDADAIRVDLTALGIELRDTPAGTEWNL